MAMLRCGIGARTCPHNARRFAKLPYCTSYAPPPPGVDAQLRELDVRHKPMLRVHVETGLKESVATPWPAQQSADMAQFFYEIGPSNHYLRKVVGCIVHDMKGDHSRGERG